MHGSFSKGQILVEIIIAIGLMAVIAALVLHSGFAGKRSTKVSGEHTIMLGLAQEATEAFEAISKSDWHDVYNLSGKGSTEYYPAVSVGTWTATTTASYKTVIINSVNYDRWVIIDNVSRHVTTRDIESTYNSANDDPSTQKITINVTSSGLPNLQIAQYITRSRNTTAIQTDWSGGSGQATNPTAGFDANYNNQFDSSTDANTAAGSIKILTQ